jgi:hypothetical protein
MNARQTMLKGLTIRSRRAPSVPVGAVFRRPTQGRTAETAQVLAIADDKAGIPHVRYRLSVGRPGSDDASAEDRTLSLAAFVQQFPERIGIDDAA